ncbi:hypothetical protein [Sarcina ventriculi]|nr:hypothetical protein [Clostridiaceae bacterium]
MIRLFENYIGENFDKIEDIDNPIFHFSLLNELIKYYLDNDSKNCDKLKMKLELIKNNINHKYKIGSNFNSVTKNILDEKIELIEKQLFLSKNMKETEYLIEDIYDILVHGYDYRNDPYGYIYKIGVAAPPIGLPFEKYADKFSFYDKIHQLKSMYLILKIFSNIKVAEFKEFEDFFEKII